MKAKNPTKKDKDRVKELVWGLDGLFNTINYDLGFIWATEDFKECAASVDVDEPYQRLVITIYPSFWNHDRDNQRKFILHEMCHVLTDPMNSVIKNLQNGILETDHHRSNAVERSTSYLTEILDAFLLGSYKKKKQAYAKYIKK